MRTTAIMLFGIVVVLVSTAGPLATAAPVPKHLQKEPESEKTKLQGKWKVESLQLGGKDIAGGLGPNFEMTIEFSGDKLIATANIGGTAQKTTATVKHDTATGVKRFTTTDTTTVQQDGKGTAKTEKDEHFSYAFDGDKLLLAASTASKKAPDPRKPGASDMVLVLVRVK